MNAAETVLLLVIVTLQMLPAVESQPVHPPKVELRSAAAVSVTAVLLA